MLFNSTQRKGVFVLLFFIIVLVVLPRHFLRKQHDFFLLQVPPEMEEDSLLSEQVAQDSTPPKKKSSRTTVRRVELNAADSAALDAIKGIGPYYASRILRYRERLGGYHSVEQLKELKMKYLDVDSIKRFLTVNPARIVKRSLDTMDFKMILKHPYLEYEDVKKIFNAKRKWGNISYDLLEANQILPPKSLEKIKPYFQ